jgi:hypothetical protein
MTEFPIEKGVFLQFVKKEENVAMFLKFPE